MKTALLLLSSGICLWFCNPGTERRVTAKNIILTGADTINFKTKVQPILQNNCSPCHFPGGKLYEKLPFDNGMTIITHGDAILKRIKKDDEVRLIKEFTAQHKL